VSFAPGQALGNYRILSQIGVGGMGVVYLAEHPLIGKKVALKVIHQELARNREVVSRFFREAKAVNQIGNEHIVEINDFGQTPDGDYFLIMEYLEGRTLADSLGAERVLAPERSAHIGAQIAAALGAAHHASIIHRDLKPDNVMLVPKLGDRDFVKLLDFGLAKMLADGDANQLTAQGVVLGTPQYMSPEACESKKNIDQRADIYSLGILLFQMMTGSLPFWGPAMGEILVKHVTQPPPAPRGINPNIPPAMEQVVLRCLAKDPSSRFQTMSELREALLDPDRYLSSSPPVVPSSAIASGRRGTHAGRPADPDSRSTMVGKKSPADPLALAETALPPERIPASQQKTKFLDGGAPPIPRASPSVMSPTSGPDARTAFMDGPAAAPIHAPQTPDVPPPRLPDMPPPQPARNATMVIQQRAAAPGVAGGGRDTRGPGSGRRRGRRSRVAGPERPHCRVHEGSAERRRNRRGQRRAGDGPDQHLEQSARRDHRRRTGKQARRDADHHRAPERRRQADASASPSEGQDARKDHHGPWRHRRDSSDGAAREQPGRAERFGRRGRGRGGEEAKKEAGDQDLHRAQEQEKDLERHRPQ